MRCFVTGATGHIGSFLVRYLLIQGQDVAAHFREHSNPWRLEGVLERVHPIRLELSDQQRLRGELERWRPDAVFHLGWGGVTADTRSSSDQITRNVVDSLALFEAAQQAGCGVWIGVGSQAEYGHYEERLRETSVCAPVTPYGVAKHCVGMLTQKLCALAEMRYIWVRLFATYGPGDDPKRLIPTIIAKLLNGRSPDLTSGEQLWDYLYIDDAVTALFELASRPDAEGIFNLGSGQVESVRQIALWIRDRIDTRMPLGLGILPYQPGQIMRLEADVSRIREITQWVPQVDIQEGLRRTVDWYQENR